MVSLRRVISVVTMVSVVSLSFAAAANAQVAVPPTEKYAATARSLETFITKELRDHGIPAASIVLVDDQQIVWAKGFGFAKLQDSVLATAETVHRVGSVSKLFTDIGVMQLVERGQLDLDAPITRYLPEFRPDVERSASNWPEADRAAWQTPITLRHLMSHRAGLLREPPVGNYFETSEPSLEAMVRSINGRELIYPPGYKLKYSNAAIGVVGYVLERTQKEPFTRYLKRVVLEPMGLNHSAFEPLPQLKAGLADAIMWGIDGRVFPAPTFQLGMSPAGSMYTTVLDLGRFLSTLFNGGRAANGTQIVRRETLEEMWKPQFAAPNARSGGGLGFFVDEFEGTRVVRHGGAIYGFATDLAALPDRQLGVAVVLTKDVANNVSERIANHALSLMLGKTEALPFLQRLNAAEAKRIEGRYANEYLAVDLAARNDHLYLDLPRNVARVDLWRIGQSGALVSNDALSYGVNLQPLTNRVVLGRDTLRRAELLFAPEPPSERWRDLVGEYGWDHDVLYILENEGKLTALIEWFFKYPLQEIGRDTFRFPQYGLYDNEKVIFRRDALGKVSEVEAASVVFKRRLMDIETGKTFQIKPQKPVSELRRIARAARPPVETGEFLQPELVELRSLDPTIKYDIRYATTNNFMGAVFYPEARARLQRPAAEALVRAQQKLKQRGYGLLIHDAYRPWYVTRMFWDATPPAQRIFVADPAQGSRHNRGAAVDLTLYDLKTGRPVEMVGGYDEFSDRSFPDYPGGTSRQRWLRELLRDAMEAEGFTVYDFEWWHFDYRDWRRFPIQNVL